MRVSPDGRVSAALTPVTVQVNKGKLQRFEGNKAADSDPLYLQRSEPSGTDEPSEMFSVKDRCALLSM